MSRPLCFVLMPFRTKTVAGLTVEFDRVYEQVIRPAVVGSGMACIRSDDEEEIGAIIHKSMFERLMLCPYAVADLTMANANVHYELGIRHAVRPWTTVLISAAGFRLPFDIAPAPVLRYHLEENGTPSESDYENDRQLLMRRLAVARVREVVDSPLFELFNRLVPANTSDIDTATFEERIEESVRVRQQLNSARTAADVLALRAGLTDLDSLDSTLLIELLVTLGRFKLWSQMIELINDLPKHLRRNATVREQQAMALNRLTPGSKDAEFILTNLRDEQGPSAETLGILGRVYKDRWENAGSAALRRGYLDEAIAIYRRGFETDWRDPYPGINAVHLLWLRDRSDQEWQELLPVVEYSTRRRVESGVARYWDFATMIEIALYRGDLPAAQYWLGKALASDPAPAEAESTVQAILRIRSACEGDSKEWDEIIADLEDAASSTREPEHPSRVQD